jgi:hypothetical protein
MFYLWYPPAVEKQNEINRMIDRPPVPDDWETEGAVETPGLFRRALWVVRSLVATCGVKAQPPHDRRQTGHDARLSQNAAMNAIPRTRRHRAAKAVLSAPSPTKR